MIIKTVKEDSEWLVNNFPTQIWGHNTYFFLFFCFLPHFFGKSIFHIKRLKCKMDCLLPDGRPDRERKTTSQSV